MKKLIVIILVLISLGSYAQTPPRTGYLVQTAKWKFVNPIWLDSGAYITKISKYGGQNRYLVYDSVKGTIGYRFVSSATTIDTTSLSNRINLRVKYTDTASMLAKYLRSADTLKLRRDVNLKVPYTGATTNVNIGANTYIGHSLKSDASDGVLLEAANGTDVGIFGAGNTANSSLYGGLTIGSITSGNGTDSVVVASSAGLLKKRPASAFGTTYTGGNGIIVGGSTIYRDSIKSTGQYGNTWGNRMYLGSSNNRSVKFRTNNLQRMVIDSIGNIGIGTTTPQGQLDIFGKFRVNIGSAASGELLGNATSIDSYTGNTNLQFLASPAIPGTATVQFAYYLSGWKSAIEYTNGTSALLLMKGGGKIGIGTSQPSSQLHISNAPIATSAYASLSIGNTPLAFDGATTGKANLAVTGTYQAINSVGAVAYNYISFQKNGLNRYQVDSTGKETFASTITAGGTTGNQTINKPSGTVNIAAAGTTVTVTNSLVSTSSIVVAVVRTNDTTAYIKNVVPSAGSFVINLGAAATSEVSIGFIVYN